MKILNIINVSTIHIKFCETRHKQRYKAKIKHQNIPSLLISP